ncbi:MAG: hypothetical protein P4K86_09880 [Terracidiphilus sp.]|nr:hypothetical protein [Terracidiphilus sp.]
MTQPWSAHLSEEALDDVLIGLGSPESDAHLAECEACRSQLEQFRSGMRNFNQASLAWSDARPLKSLPARSKVRQAAFAPVGWAFATAVLLLIIGVPVWRHDHRIAPSNGTVPAVTIEDSPAQIAQDNDLLRSVDEALNSSEASPISEYHLSDGPQLHRKARPELRNQ